MKGVFDTSTSAKKEKQSKIEAIIQWIPVIIMLTIIPLIVKLTQVNLTGSVMDTLNQTEMPDFYSQYKAAGIIIVCIAMAVVTFLSIEKKNIKFDKTILFYFIGAGIFLGFSLLSTVLSDNKHTAWWGMPDRAEGMVIIFCYIFITFYTLYILREKKDYKILVISLGILVVVTTVLGIFQYAGYDLLTHVGFIKQLIVGKGNNVSISSKFPDHVVVGTMNHYNYMGSFGAMMVPFFGILTLFESNRKYKLGLGILTLCTMFLLFGSTSRAGFIGLITAMIFGLIIFIKQIFRKWKISAMVVAICLAAMFVFSAITGGAIFQRIPSMLKDAVSLVSGSESDFDYRDHIPIRDISHEDNKEKIVCQTGTLYLSNNNGQPGFTDDAGNIVEYIKDETNKYTTQDQRFAPISFEQESVVDAAEGSKVPYIISLSYNGEKDFFFMLDDEKGVVMADTCPIKEEEIEYPETVGFKGKEKLGSARGYIWSRSIPLMKKTILIGNGPDTYALKFPQQDYLGKWWAYDTPNMIVDKAHSLYMGMWINNGALALAGFLMLTCAYLVQCLKLYAGKDDYEKEDVLGVATMLAVVGFLGSGIFNDSVVSVTPVFCILWGAGMGINFLLKKNLEK